MTFLSILTLLLSSTTYYVSSSQGDDQNNGLSPDSAWETLAHLNSQTFEPGDQILFRAGDEFIGQLVISNSGIKGAPILFGKYGDGDKPILNAAPSPGGAYMSSILIRNQSFIELENLEVTNNRMVSRDGVDDQQGYGIFVHNNGNAIMEHFHFRNLTVREVYAISVEGIDFDDLQVAGIYFRSERNNTVGLEKHIRDILIEDSFITLTGKFGIWTQHAGGADGVGDEIINRNKNLIFRNNHTYKTGGSGITPGRSYNLLMEGNTFEFPGSGEDERMANRGSGAWFFSGRNIIAQHNKTLYARGDGDTYSIHIDHSNKNVFVQFNYSEDSEGGFAEILGENINSVYRYNVSVNDGFRNNARSIWVSDYAGPTREGIFSDKNYVYNNTIYVSQNRTPGIRLVGDNTFIHNNILYAQDGSSIGESELFFDISEGSELNVSNNLYQGTIASGFINLDQNSVFGDPLFENIGGQTAEDYRLNEGSPAFEAGLAFEQPKFPKAGTGIFKDIPEYPEEDMFGNPIVWQNGAIAIGAFAGEVPPLGTDIEISGRFLNEDDEPVIGLAITLFENDLELFQTVTDTNGDFSFSLQSEDRAVELVTEITDALQEKRKKLSLLANAELGEMIIPWTAGEISDHEGNIYRTVRIGNQIWMAENLKVSTYKNGEPISNPQDNTAWSSANSSETGAWVHYNNSDANESIRGKMYNWHAVADERGLCPVGWEVPTDDDVQEMEAHLGMPTNQLAATSFDRGSNEAIGDKLRSTDFWANPNEGADNSTGFSFRSTGIRFAGGLFQDLPEWGAFWTSSDTDNGAYRRVLRFDEDGVNRNAANRGIGIAIRCIKADNDEIKGVLINEENEPIIGHPINLLLSEEIIATDTTDTEGLFEIRHSTFSSDLVIQIESSNALQEKLITEIQGGFNTDLEVITVPWKDGQVFDHDGNVYRTVQIGDQLWMAENLKTTHYSNGDPIEIKQTNDDWDNANSSETGAAVFYNNSAANANIRGKLYNWYAVNDERGLCPVGWEVPSDTQIKQLEITLGMSESEAEGTNFTRGQDEGIGQKLRSISYWSSPNEGATNQYGFSFRSTGIRFVGGLFADVPEWGGMWTSTESGVNAYRRVFKFDEPGINRNTTNKGIGLGVRCIQSEEITSSINYQNSENQAGWRMVSVPFKGVSVADLADQNQISGIPGANAHYDMDNLENEGTSPNFLFFEPQEFDPASEGTTGWVAPQDFETTLTRGRGYIWYFFDNNNFPSVSLDEFTLTATGPVPSNDISVFIENNAWNLVGNPFPANINLGQLDGTGLYSAAAQIWDANKETYVIKEFRSDEYLSEWQGFFIESETAEEFVFPLSAQTGTEAEMVSEEKEMRLSFYMNGVDDITQRSTTDQAIHIVWDESASLGWDLRDVRKLEPISDTFATLAIVGQRNDKPILKAQESLPVSFDGKIELPMSLQLSAISGIFTINWDGIESIPDGLSAILKDHKTGNEVSIINEESYTFDASESDPENHHRFTLSLSYSPVSSDFDSDIPQKLSLDQNYPNPFNPTTQINFEIPQDSHVSLIVYDVIGRKVSKLVDENRAPGSYRVRWDASRFSSGVYFYRLEVDGNVITRRMTLIK